MPYIFYDTETSSRDLLGQILTYAFVVTDDHLQPIKEFTGSIALNRTQLPEPEAILVNRINLDTLQSTGQPEHQAAEAIYQFLNTVVGPQGTATLVGFNSNRFDLQFLRNLLIRYGWNPYFSGRLKNIDVLHFAQYVAMKHPDLFPWQRDESDPQSPFLTFKLERLAEAFELLDTPQTHDAKEDVLLTIDLVRTLQDVFGESFTAFVPFELGISKINQDPTVILTQPGIARGEDIDDLVADTIWTPIIADRNQKNAVFLNLTHRAKNPEAPLVESLKYINANKHFFRATPLTGPDHALWSQMAKDLQDELNALNIKTLADYFALIPKEWDIEYQIHEMGFERIDQLRYVVRRLLDHPQTYAEDLPTLLAHRRQNQNDPKDTYLIQLYNRVYLNFHPNPRPEDLRKYLGPRYAAGTMLRDTTEFRPLSERIQHWAAYCETASPEDQALLAPVLRRYEAVAQQTSC